LDAVSVRNSDFHRMVRVIGRDWSADTEIVEDFGIDVGDLRNLCVPANVYQVYRRRKSSARGPNARAVPKVLAE
jgi:hypothetical protein